MTDFIIMIGVFLSFKFFLRLIVKLFLYRL